MGDHYVSETKRVWSLSRMEGTFTARMLNSTRTFYTELEFFTRPLIIKGLSGTFAPASPYFGEVPVRIFYRTKTSSPIENKALTFGTSFA